MNNNTREIYNAMNDIAIVLSPLSEKLKSNRRFIESLLHIFKGVTDFRDPLKITYRLENILCICLLIALRGEFTSFYNASVFIKVKAAYFRRLKLIEGKEIPSHNTLRRIFMCVDADELRDSLQSRMRSMIEKITNHTGNSDGKVRLLCGDGKTFNGSGRKEGKRYVEGKRNVNVFNVLDSSSSLVIASIPLDDKESEIPAFQKLLPKYDLTHTMVTADALHCQIKTLRLICDHGGEYTVTVKDNQSGKKQHIIDMIEAQ